MKTLIVYDGMNILMKGLSANQIINSEYFNVKPIMYFLSTIFNDIVDIETSKYGKKYLFEKMVKHNIYDVFMSEDIDIYVVFDVGMDLKRKNINSDYKKQRKNYKSFKPGMFDEDGIHKEILQYRNILNKIFNSMGIKTIMFPFIEGDVVIAYIVEKLKDKYDNVVISSNDSDFYEILYNNVCITYKRKGERTIITDNIENQIKIYKKLNLISKKCEIKEFYPSLRNMAYFKSLLGEPVDGIKRVKGIRINLIRKLFNLLIDRKIEVIPNFEEFYTLFSEVYDGVNIYLDLFERYKLISLVYYIDKLMSPNDIITINHIILSEKEEFNNKKFIEIMNKLELSDFNFSWLFS